MPLPTILAAKVAELLLLIRDNALQVRSLPVEDSWFLEREVFNRQGGTTGYHLPIAFMSRVFWFKRNQDGTRGRFYPRSRPVREFMLGPFEEIIQSEQVSETNQNGVVKVFSLYRKKVLIQRSL